MTGSFRDPDGFVFLKDGVLYRQVNASYEAHYRRLMDSHLYEDLVSAGRLIGHREILGPSVLKPERIPFVSYPYEWSFSQLKDAALLTLEIQKKALEHGMSLKDASAYNVQWIGSHPVFIDTLSFEIYPEGRPWTAYRQFCQHFLAPLALMSFRDARLNGLLRVHLDGVPIDLASRLMPWKALGHLDLMCHIGLHGKFKPGSSGGVAATPGPVKNKVGLSSLKGILQSLERAVHGLKWEAKTQWSGYYKNQCPYSEKAMAHKKALVEQYLEAAKPKTVWDLGANDGLFSRVATGKNAYTVAFELDPVCIETNYLRARAENTTPRGP